jgi:hypothetical protein
MSIGPLETTHGPRNPEDLTDITLELCLKRLPGYVAERYGSSGQSQHGVDVRAYRPGGRHKLFQCKRREKLTTNQMDDELRKSEGYPFPKESYTFYTTVRHDNKLQDHAVDLSEKYAIPVKIEFWDKIKEEVLKYDDLKKRFFRDYLIEVELTNSIHAQVDISMTHYDFVVTKLPHEKRFGNQLLLVTSLQTKRACYYRLGDYYYNFVPVIGPGRMDAFLVWKWFEQFSSFEEMRESYQTREFYLPESEIYEFQLSLAQSDPDDE